MLFDELTNLLEQSLLSSNVPADAIAGLSDCVLFLRNSSASTPASGGALCHCIAQLLFLPLRAVEAVAAASASSYSAGGAVSGCVSGVLAVDQALSGVVQVAHSLVLYVLLDMLHLSTSTASFASSPPSTSGSAMAAHMLAHIRRFAGSVGAAAGLTHTVTSGVLCLWQIDAGLAVSEAVRLLCSSNTTILADERILVAALRRLLSSGRLVESKALLLHLERSGHPLTRSSSSNYSSSDNARLYVMATAACIARTDSWQVLYIRGTHDNVMGVL